MKIAPQTSFDEEMDFDGFSELDKLDPIESAQQLQQPQQQSLTQQPYPQNQPASVPPSNNAITMHNGTVCVFFKLY